MYNICDAPDWENMYLGGPRDSRYSSFCCGASVQSAVLETKQSGQKTACLKMICQKKLCCVPIPWAILTCFRFDIT